MHGSNPDLAQITEGLISIPLYSTDMDNLGDVDLHNGSPRSKDDCEIYSMSKNSLKVSEPQLWTVGFADTEALAFKCDDVNI